MGDHMEKKAIIAPGVTPEDNRRYDKQAAEQSVKSRIKQLDRDFTRTAARRMQTALNRGS